MLKLRIAGSENYSMRLKPSDARRVWAISGKDLTSYAVLFWPVGDYLIIYRADRQPIEIVAVTQGSRDIPSFLRRRAGY
jgi:hypothetical protein